MSLLSPIKDHHSERRLFIGRVVLAVVFASIALSIVIARLVQLQVIDYDHFMARSQGNRVRMEAVAPIRGLIFDRKGRIVAENLPAYQLELIPEQVDDLEDTLRRLAELGSIAAEDIPRFLDLSSNGPRFKPVTLNLRLTDDEIANFAVQRPRFPGVDFQPRLIRHYPDGAAVAHAVGYVGALNTEDLQRVDPSRYAGTSHVGKTGIEASREPELHGDSGFQHVVTNARGRQVPGESRNLADSLPADETPEPGHNVYLTIDLELQQLANDLMADKRGAVVAIDPWNGEILAFVSAPSFDPNQFAVGMTTAEYATVLNDPDRPLFSRAVRGTYPPGSTIKPMLSLAALATGATNLTRKTVCRGFFTLPNNTHRYRDWKPEGHGSVDLHDAITQSCDVYFYEISNELGINRMHDYLDQFGLGRKTGIDISGERAGIVPSTTWKRNNFSTREQQKWYDGETIIASIGQGFMLATPLQLAGAAAAMATRGTLYQPHMIAAIEDPVSGERTLTSPVVAGHVDIDNEFYWEYVIGAMNDVMQHPRGTAYATGRDAPYTMAGKSGTAQVFSVAQEDEYDEEEISERLRDHALFIAFAPVENPRIAVAVVVENGSSGSRVAAPIARAIMDRYLGFDDATE